MSCLQSLPSSPSAISSLALAFSPSLFVARDGTIRDQSGQEVVRASLTARQVKALGLLMSGTSGRPGTTSSESADLSRCSESRFLSLSSTAGWTSSPMTWKQTTTPSGRLVSALVTSAPRSKGSASTLLPSISAREWKDSSRGEVLARLDRGDGVAKRICALSPTLRSSQEVVGLNPSFAAWIMGLPSAWTSCTPTAMR